MRKLLEKLWEILKPILEIQRMMGSDVYFDEELYKNRFKIEKAYAWFDSFKALLVRFEILNIIWRTLH